MPGYTTRTDAATNIVLATKSDTVNDPAGPFRGIVFVTAQAIKITTHENDDITLPSGLLSAGVVHNIRVKRVWSTGTGGGDVYGVV